MRVAYLAKGEIRYVEDFPKPIVGDDQVLLEVLLAGICGTDIALKRGYADYQGIPGHEFVARVVELGANVESAWLGQRVAAEINQYCGQCSMCQRDKRTHCLQRQVIGIRQHQGAFAQYIAVNANTLHRLPEQLSDEQAIFIEPLAAAYRILEQIRHIEYEKVLIIGAGRLGQLIARVFATTGKHVGIVVRSEKQRALLANLPVMCLSESGVLANDWQIVVEASGQQSGLELALRAVCATGCVVMKSAYSTPIALQPANWVVKELTVLGSRCGDFSVAIDALIKGDIDPAALIESCYPLSEIAQAMDVAASSGTMKVMIRP